MDLYKSIINHNNNYVFNKQYGCIDDESSVIKERNKRIRLGGRAADPRTKGDWFRMTNQDEKITRLKGDLQIVYKKLEAAHLELQVSQSSIVRAHINTLESEMDAIVDELIRVERDS